VLVNGFDYRVGFSRAAVMILFATVNVPSKRC